MVKLNEEAIDELMIANDLIYCEELSTNKTIILAENGEIINKEW